MPQKNIKEMNPIEKYCEKQGYELAQKIDEKMAIIIKPRPKWMPKKIYNAVIKKVVEIVEVNSNA